MAWNAYNQNKINYKYWEYERETIYKMLENILGLINITLPRLHPWENYTENKNRFLKNIGELI